MALRVSHNPFFNEMKPDDAHMLTLARIPGIKTLNYSDINDKERENAELYYLSKIKTEVEEALASAKGDSEQESQIEKKVLEAHPQYTTLAKKHSPPPIVRPSEVAVQLDARQDNSAAAAAEAEAARGGYGPNTLWARIVTLHLKVIPPPNIQPHNNSSSTTDPSSPSPSPSSPSPIPQNKERPSAFTMQLPKSTTMYRLKSLIASRLGLWSRDIRLVYETGELDPVGRHIKGLGQPGGGREIWEAESESGSGSEDDSEGEEDWDLRDYERRRDGGVEEWDRQVEGGEVDREEDGVGNAKRKKKKKPTWNDYDPKKWIRREVEFTESMRTLGYWVEGRDADVRVEILYERSGME